MASGPAVLLKNQHALSVDQFANTGVRVDKPSINTLVISGLNASQLSELKLHSHIYSNNFNSILTISNVKVSTSGSKGNYDNDSELTKLFQTAIANTNTTNSAHLKSVVHPFSNQSSPEQHYTVTFKSVNAFKNNASVVRAAGVNLKAAPPKGAATRGGCTLRSTKTLQVTSSGNVVGTAKEYCLLCPGATAVRCTYTAALTFPG